MKRYLPYILCFVLIASVACGAFALGAHAQGTSGVQNAAGGSGGSWVSGLASVFGLNPFDLVNSMLAMVVNAGLSIMGWLVALSGGLLNISMNLTLNIKAFVDGTTAIYTTWTAIRDISSLFIIFFLLWAAIQMIIGIQDPKFGQLIKNIVVAGVLVNFSFFAAGLGIDASNIVSMQLYNAIAPANSLNSKNLIPNQNTISSTMGDGGLSDIFMQSLQIASVYNNALAPTGSNQSASVTNGANAISAPLKIILMGITGIIIEFTAACSFTLAAGAFIFRFVLLLVLLAFSPIWFVSQIIPSDEIKKYAKKWTGTYFNMLLFMPVYLLLMYLALNVLTTSTFFHNGYAGNLITNPSAPWYSNFMILGVNAFIVIFLLNLPLVAAIEMGGVATGWMKKTGLTGGDIWRGVSGITGRNTVGRLGYSAQQYLQKNFPVASNTLVGQALINKTVGAAANAGWGSGTSRTAAAAAAKTRGQAQQAGRTLNSLRAAIAANDHQAVGRIIGGMSDSTIANLDKKLLKHDMVLEHLDEGAHKAIRANANLSDQDKNEIHNNRMNLLTNSVASYGAGRNAAIVQKMMNNASGDTLSKLDDPNVANGQATLRNDDFIRHLKASHMKDMENTVSQPTRKHIGDRINLWTGFNANQHNAHGYYTKNVHMWS